MAEIRTVTTLKFKRDEITRTIMNYENKIAQAKFENRYLAFAFDVFFVIGLDVGAPLGATDAF
jgi:hypothetical protein